MSYLKLAIKDFEAINSLQAVFKNSFICITGASNNGKSSIFRAIYALLYNKHNDNSIQQGKDSYMIGLEYNDNKVLCKRNSTQSIKTSYQVDGKNIIKVGRNTVDEVDEALNMALVDLVGSKIELNIQEQFSYPFMQNWPAGKLYTFLSQSSTQEDLYAVLKSMKSDLKDIDDRRKKLEGTVELAQKTYEDSRVIYNNLIDSDLITTTILNLQTEVSYVANLETLCNRLSICDKDLLSVDVTLESIKTQLDIVEPLDMLIDEVATLDILRNDMTKIKDKLIRYKDINQTYNILNNLVLSLDFNPIDSMIQDIDELTESRNKLANKLEAMENRSQSIVKYEQELLKVNNRLQDTADLDSCFEEYNNLNNFVSNISKDINLLSNKDNELVKTTTDILELDNQLETINKELSTFKVCPVCGRDF